MSTIEIRTLWGTRKGFGPEYAELMVAWDEYCIDANPEGFDADCEKAIASWGDDVEAARFITIRVDRDAIEGAFAETVVAGRVTT